MTILAAPETPAPARDAFTPCPLAEAAAHLDVVREQQDHALTVQRELLALLPVLPSSFTICSFVRSFQGRYGVTITMPLECTDLRDVQGRLGGSLLVELRDSAQGVSYVRHELTGVHAGVPFEVWTNVYPRRPAVTA